jgi:hypothetical protein
MEMIALIVLSHLHIPVELDISGPPEIPAIKATMKFVKLSMEAWIDNEIETSSRTKDLLTWRLELDSDTRKLVKRSLDFRHYPRIKTSDHRHALTCIAPKSTKTSTPANQTRTKLSLCNRTDILRCTSMWSVSNHGPLVGGPSNYVKEWLCKMHLPSDALSTRLPYAAPRVLRSLKLP